MNAEKQDAIESIITALGHRFEHIPAELSQKMEGLEIDKIDSLWEVTFDAESIDAVMVAVGQAELV